MPYKNPEHARAAKREWKRLHDSGGSRTPGRTLLPEEFKIATARDVLALVEEQVNAVRADREAATLEKARTVGYLAAVALRAVETADTAARVEALERALKLRPAPAQERRPA